MQQAKDKEQIYKAKTWSIRRDIPLTILSWMAVIAIIFYLLSFFEHAIVLLAIAAIFAYALVPVVQFFSRFLPRVFAIILAYILVLFGLGFIVYLTLETAVEQITLLIQTTQSFITPQQGQSLSPLIQSLQRIGISEEQIVEASKQLTNQLETVTSSIIPLLNAVFTSILDIFITVILSIYLLLDGNKMISWIKGNLPVAQKSRFQFLLNTLQKIVGGYIRGQFLLSAIIGVLVGLGMFLFQVQYAVLLGLLAFVLSFVPIIGTFISGAACVLIALSKGWIVAIFVLIYFIVVHIIEGDILGPRIVGRALGLHPIISLLAVIGGANLAGIQGAIFAAPIAGVTQAFLVAAWYEWKLLHPHHFKKGQKTIVKKMTKLL